MVRQQEKSHRCVREPLDDQRRRDDNKKYFFALLRDSKVGMGGREENRPQNTAFRGKRHDNKILKVQI